jgi:hypothetical protein
MLLIFADCNAPGAQRGTSQCLVVYGVQGPVPRTQTVLPASTRACGRGRILPSGILKQQVAPPLCDGIGTGTMWHRPNSLNFQQSDPT